MEENELVVVPKGELVEKNDLIKSAEEKCQKLKSDFTRYKKRVEDREEAVSGKVHGELARRLLNVADSLDRAMDGYKTNPNSGFELVEKMLDGTRNNLEMTYNQLLSSLGVTPIAPSPGDRLNDELHTAIEATSNTFLPDKTILSLVRKGYTLNGELIRPAEVVISRGGETGEEEAESKGIVSKILSGFESRVFRRRFEELDIRERELKKNEEMLQRSAKEFDAREEELKKMVEEGAKRREAEELRVHELEQNKAVLNVELKESKRQLHTIQESLTELEAKKDKTVIEDIALTRYYKELLEEKENLLKEIEELKRTKESLNTERQEEIREADLQMKDMGMCL
ncbi:Molecular chaperone GrpE (heat shock protein) [Methanophagales archaeon]|nr:Molecular chaperone GrpE (heat shock protein) [Methanophagales archaeon]